MKLEAILRPITPLMDLQDLSKYGNQCAPYVISSLKGETEAIIYFIWLFLSAAPAPFFIAAAACMSATLGGRTNALRSLRL
jgi:hypothetical protein